MPAVIVSYGDYAEYRVTELPLRDLQELAARYPLTLAEGRSPSFDDLAITLALHAELKRRSDGGDAEHHIPSRRQLAQEVVKRGFQQASRQYHPDGSDGDHEAQVRLGEVRDQLQSSSEKLWSNDLPPDAIIIPPPPGVSQLVYRKQGTFGGITDDDVPF